MTNMAENPDVEIIRRAECRLTCQLNDRVSSIMRLGSLLAWLTLMQPRSTVLTKPSIRFRALLLITMTSVLSGFIDKPLWSSQCWTAWKNSDNLGVELSPMSAMYSCVSSANCAWLTPNELMTSRVKRCTVLTAAVRTRISEEERSTVWTSAVRARILMERRTHKRCLMTLSVRRTLTDFERHTRYELT